MKYAIEGSTLEGIADAIRQKRGTAEKLSPSEFKTEVLAIETKPDVWNGVVILENMPEESVSGTEGLAYELSKDGTYYICSGIGTATETDIIIANEIEGKPVYEIKTGAFSENTRISSVTIGPSVKSINYRSFYKCSSLEKVIFTDGLLESIGSDSFHSCPLKFDIIIPDSVTTIGISAFCDCDGSSNKNLYLSEKLRTIGDSTFLRAGVIHIEMHSLVTEIGAYAFNRGDNRSMTMKYNGTVAQWNSVEKGSSIVKSSIQVTCNDGEVTYS